MAIHTPTHGQTVVLFYHIHLFDFTVAPHTGRITVLCLAKAVNVPLVIELHVVRKHIYLHPLDCFPSIIFFLQFFNGFFVGSHHNMTIHADIQARYSRVFGYFHLGVTVNTGYFVIP